MFSGLSFHPHHRPLKAGEKLKCARPVRYNGRVSDPWPCRPGPFFLDQALPFATVGYNSTAWQQKEGKHLLRFLFFRPQLLFSLSLCFIFFSLLGGFVDLLEDGQELLQVPRFKFRQQLHNPSFWQPFVTGPKETGVTVPLRMKGNTL